MNQTKLNKNFYKLENVKQAIEDFRDVCSLDLKDEENYFIINTSEEIKLEFQNYVLGLHKK